MVADARPGGDLDEAELADDGFAAPDLVAVVGDFELVERGADAVRGGLGGLADDGHARGVWLLALADRERDDVDAETAEERGDTGEDAGLVLNECYEGVEHGDLRVSVRGWRLVRSLAFDLFHQGEWTLEEDEFAGLGGDTDGSAGVIRGDSLVED